MPRLDQIELRVESGGHCGEVSGEAGLGGLELQHTHRRNRFEQRRGAGADLSREFRQDAGNFGLLQIAQADVFIVQLDGFKRLDEHGLAAGTRAMQYARSAAALLGAHWQHESVVPQRDQLILEHALAAQTAKLRSYGTLDGHALRGAAAAKARELGAGGVIQRTVGEQRAPQGAPQIRGVGDFLCEHGQLGPLLPFLAQERIGEAGGGIEESGDLDQLGTLKYRARRLGAAEQTGRVQDASESETAAREPESGLLIAALQTGKLISAAVEAQLAELSTAHRRLE